MLRLTLGVIFIYASWDKIVNPEQFASALSNYRILPRDLINLVALLMPWVEAVTGIFLIFGIFEWTSLTVFTGLMMIFMAAIAISLARGLSISCGCFTSDPNADKMTWLTMLRDSYMLILALAGYWLLYLLKPPPFSKSR